MRKGYCDYGHEDPDVRRLPFGGAGASVFVCKGCHRKEVEGETPTSRRKWENLRPQSTEDQDICRCTHPRSMHVPWNGDASGETHCCRGCFREDYDLSARKTRNMTSYHHFTEGGDAIPDRLPDDIRNMKSRTTWYLAKAEHDTQSGPCPSCNRGKTIPCLQCDGHHDRPSAAGDKDSRQGMGWFFTTCPSEKACACDPKGGIYNHGPLGCEGTLPVSPHRASKWPSPRVPDRLPREIRNMKFKSQAIFKSEDAYERCGHEGCDHPRANHNPNGGCPECARRPGAYVTDALHRFESKPAITGNIASRRLNPVPVSRVRVPHPNASEVHTHHEHLLDALSEMRTKFYGTATDKTEKSMKVYDPRPKRLVPKINLGGRDVNGGSAGPRASVRTQAASPDRMRDLGKKNDRGDLSYQPKVRKSNSIWKAGQ